MTDMTLHEVLFSTRSMRHFKADELPRKEVEYVLEAAEEEDMRRFRVVLCSEYSIALLL